MVRGKFSMKNIRISLDEYKIGGWIYGIRKVIKKSALQIRKHWRWKQIYCHRRHHKLIITSNKSTCSFEIIVSTFLISWIWLITYWRAFRPSLKYIVDNFSSIILHSNDFYANIHQLFWNNQFFSEIYHIRVSSFLRVSLFCRFHHSSPLHKLLGCFSAMMVEEETVGGVERSNLLHVLSIKFEVEEIQILLHSFLMNSLRDDDYVALQQPA